MRTGRWGDDVAGLILAGTLIYYQGWIGFAIAVAAVAIGWAINMVARRI